MKFNWKMSKDKWLVLLAAGMILLVIAIPSGSGIGRGKTPEETVGGTGLKDGIVTEPGEAVTTAAKADRTYEEQLEQRIKQILKNVDGVGTVDVMIVLKSSEEKVMRVDRNSSNSATEEKDSAGGTRKQTSAEQQESTVLTGSGNNTAPIVEKELRPEIEGIVVSAQGGGSPVVQAEISAAMEALFDLPAHKIKVLKRVG